MTTHFHHIKAKFRGGTNDPDNLIELTVKEHAFWHWCDYIQYGDFRDLLAYKGLMGEFDKEEIVRELRASGGRKSYPVGLKKWREENPEANRKMALLNLEKAIVAASSPKAIAKRKETFSKIGHQKGQKNSQYGTMWITDGTKRGSRKIPKTDPIPEGFHPGRVCHKQGDELESTDE